MSRNRTIAEAFAAEFDPPLSVVQTRRINGIPHRDAWLVAQFDRAAGYGITAHAYGGQLHAFLEVMTGADEAASAGKVLAATMAQFKHERDTKAVLPVPPAEGHASAGERPQEGHAEQDQG